MTAHPPSGGGQDFVTIFKTGSIDRDDYPGLAVKKARRVFTTDPGMGEIRHADAGYEAAIDAAERTGVAVPMRDYEDE